MKTIAQIETGVAKVLSEVCGDPRMVGEAVWELLDARGVDTDELVHWAGNALARNAILQEHAKGSPQVLIEYGFLMAIEWLSNKTVEEEMNRSRWGGFTDEEVDALSVALINRPDDESVVANGIIGELIEECGRRGI